MESGFRYTPTTCFETFPFPQPTGEQRAAIAEAARQLNELREGWLNPEGAAESELKKRTLTNLYNARPTWLQLAHEQLDKAFFDAYGWPDDLADPEILERLLALKSGTGRRRRGHRAGASSMRNPGLPRGGLGNLSTANFDYSRTSSLQPCPTTKLKPRWDVHLSGDDDQLGCAGKSLSSVLGE